jgi:hypothetical protein
VTPYKRLRKSRLDLLDTGLLPHDQEEKLASCVHPIGEPDQQPHYCRSPYCPECSLSNRRDELSCLVARLERPETQAQGNTFLGTFTLQDCAVHEIKEQSSRIQNSFNTLKRRLPHLEGYERTIEVASHEGGWNVHLHTVLVMAPAYRAGKNYMNKEFWNLLWTESAIVADADPRTSQVSKRKLGIAAKYAIKANAGNIADHWEIDLLDPRRLIDRIHQMEGVQVYTYGGVLSGKPSNEQIVHGIESGLYNSRQEALSANQRACRWVHRSKANAEIER